MAYSALRLQQFRSYRDYSVELEPGVNIVVGPNASGKTSLLEALYVISRGVSFRAPDTHLVRYGDEWTRIDAWLKNTTYTVKLQRIGGKIQKELLVNQAKPSRKAVFNPYPAVLFEPEQLRLLTGPPELRRDYLDSTARSLDPDYGRTLHEYRRALSQRNALLKQRLRKDRDDQLFVWDVRLSELGGRIVLMRESVVERMNHHAGSIYSKLSGKKTEVRVRYVPSVKGQDYKGKLLKHLTDNAHRDAELGFTGVGPHREDFAVEIDGKSTVVAASRGEVRSAVLAAKLIELALIEEHSGRKPVMLLDDVFSELDGARRHALTDYLSEYQVLITTTDADAILEHFVGTANLVPVNGS